MTKNDLSYTVLMMCGDTLWVLPHKEELKNNLSKTNSRICSTAHH